MKSLRAKHLILTVAAMFSLFVTAVSACACSHHDAVRVEAESCHGPSHEDPPAESSNGSTKFETDCNCLARTPAPAIVAKKDDKRTAVEKQIADVIELTPAIAIEFKFAGSAPVAFERPQFSYQKALLVSLPSRAPPRL